MKTSPDPALLPDADLRDRWRPWARAAAVTLLAAACLAGAFLFGLREQDQALQIADAGLPLDSAAGSSASSPAPTAAPTVPDEPGRMMSSGSAPPATGALSWPLWEFQLRQPIPPRDPSLTPPSWRLIGAAYNGSKWSVIVLRQGNAQPEYFSVGDELPGGYRIESISDQDVTLAHEKRLMVLSYIGTR